MSEQKAVNDAPDETVNDVSLENQENNDAVNDASEGMVKHETYKRAISKQKNLQMALEKEREEKQRLIEEKLEADGNKDEIIASLRGQVTDWKGKATKAVSSFAASRKSERFAQMAAKMGCNDPDLVARAYAEDLSQVGFDDSFNPDMDQLNETLERVRLERPHLFSKEAPKLANHKIEKAKEKNETKSLNQMSKEELLKAWDKSLKS